MRRGTASLSVDLDNQWSYMKTHGNPEWRELPSYLPVVVPRLLALFRKCGVKTTFFLVGADAAQTQHAEIFRSIPADGHEVGNHSYHHEPWLHLYSEADLEREISDAEAAIEGATGIRPAAFRGPGYSLSETVLKVLIRRGYLFDASTLPTFLGPLARIYYFWTANLTAEERATRKKLFGTFRDGLRPLRPYTWRLNAGTILEIPVTTMPGARVPIHFSYFLYIARYSRAAALSYFRSALTICKASGLQPSLLIHPLDVMGRGEAPPLDFFPAMQMDAAEKVGLMEHALEMVTDSFEPIAMCGHARRLLAGSEAARTELRWEPSA